MRAIAVLEEIGHRGFLPEAERGLAGALLELGDIPEAETHALRAIELTLPDDWFTVASTKLALGRERDAQGRDHEAKAVLEEAIAVIDRTDYRTERCLSTWHWPSSISEGSLVAEGDAWLVRSMSGSANQSSVAQKLDAGPWRPSSLRPARD